MSANKSPTGPVRHNAINIIINPKAGSFSPQRMKRILSGITATTHVIETTHAGHAREIAETLPADRPVFVAGGDGTINEVINGLIAARNQGRPIPPMGIIPAGTANVLAHEMQLASRPEAIIEYINTAHGQDVHPGMVNDRGFMLMTGAGPDAVTVDNVSPRMKSVLGKWAYVWQGVCTILHPPHHTLTVRIGNKTYETGGVIVTRVRHYGGPYVLTPQAGLANAQLVVVLLASTGTLDLLRYALCLVTGRLATQRDVRILPATDVMISGSDHTARLPMQVDGDPDGELPCKIGLSPHAIRLLMPAAQAG